MASSGRSRVIKRKQQSLKEPTRRVRDRDGEEAGVTKHRQVDTQEKHYNHDKRVIQLSSSIIGKAGKKLCKLQEDIRRKEQKMKSRWLEKCKQDYDQWLAEMLKELKQLMGIVVEKEDHVPRPETSSERCTECFLREKVMHRQQFEIDSLNKQLEQLKEQVQEAGIKNEDRTRKLESLNQDLQRRKETEQKNEETIRELTQKHDSTNQNLKRMRETEHNNEKKIKELTRTFDNICFNPSMITTLNKDLIQRREAERKDEETSKELVQQLDSLKEELSCEKEAKLEALTSLNQNQKRLDETEQKNEEVTKELIRKLASLNQDLKQQKESEQQNEETNRELKRKLDSVNEELSRENEAKLKAFTSLDQNQKRLKDTEQKHEETTRELTRKVDSLNKDLKQQKETEQKNEERNRELKWKLDCVNEELSREQEAKLKALISLDQNLKRLKETEQTNEETTRELTRQLDSLNEDLKRWKETDQKNEETKTELTRKLDSLNQDLKRQKVEEKKNEETTRELTRVVDSLNEEISREREAKLDALRRLSAITSSRLRDNNPNLTDLSDPFRPSKIGEMFSELYDNEWTNAYDELGESKLEVEKIQQLNAIVMTAYDCCMTLFKPCRSYLNTDRTKIDSELRQKIIGHFKRNGLVVIQQLSKGLENDICVRCKVTKATDPVAIYIRKCIAICWLMVIQDPPIVLDNSTQEKFDTSRFKGYMHNGTYTDYVVWPAVNLYNEGPLLSKGVAEGRKK